MLHQVSFVFLSNQPYRNKLRHYITHTINNGQLYFYKRHRLQAIKTDDLHNCCSWPQTHEYNKQSWEHFWFGIKSKTSANVQSKKENRKGYPEIDDI